LFCFFIQEETFGATIFLIEGNFIRGISQIGIATEKLLAFNSVERLEMRTEIDPTS
jgi:hypothetical protein